MPSGSEVTAFWMISPGSALLLVVCPHAFVVAPSTKQPRNVGRAGGASVRVSSLEEALKLTQEYVDLFARLGRTTTSDVVSMPDSVVRWETDSDGTLGVNVEETAIASLAYIAAEHPELMSP